MPPLKPLHRPIFKVILIENIKAACAALNSPDPDEKAIKLGIEQTIKDFELVPVMAREVKVVCTSPTDWEVSFAPSLEGFLDRGRLGFYKGRGIEEVIIERGVES